MNRCPRSVLASAWLVTVKSGRFLRFVLAALGSLFLVNAWAQSPVTVTLNSSWKFSTDPSELGVTQQWYTDTFDDSGWTTLLSGKSWETQGVNYSGYAWYRQKVVLPSAAADSPLELTLATIKSDDVVYFNGVRVGGFSGDYKYDNLALRTYSIPSSLVRYGASNTIAIRLWGGRISGSPNSGLVAGKYTLAIDRFRLSARPVGAGTAQEVPVQLYDLSSAQKGQAFELVFRFDPVFVTQTTPNMVYALTDYYGVAIQSGTLPVTVGSDGIVRGVVSVGSAAAQAIYLGGRFKASAQLVEAGQPTDWVDTGDEITLSNAVTMRIYRKTYAAGSVALPSAQDYSSSAGMYAVIVPNLGVGITNLTVNDTANAVDWSYRTNLQVGDAMYGDRTYTISTLPSAYAGAQWIRSANDSRAATVNPTVSFSISQGTTIYLAIDKRRMALAPWVRTFTADHLTFAARDQTPLPALTATYEATPYGSLKLVDQIDCSTPLATEIHPYLQGSFASHGGDYETPAVGGNVPVNTILGKAAREPDYGWFAYRIGRGSLTPGKTYLLRIEYPEDKPRYSPIYIEAGLNYMGVGWKNGVSPTDVYDNWPLSNGWNYYDVIIPLGDFTTGTGGAQDGDPHNGVWVYCMNERKPGDANHPDGYYWAWYQGGAAVATMKLYEIDPVANAPAINRPPATLPQRTLLFDWERQPLAQPTDIVNYAKLMGYSAVSPLTLKWAFMNYGDPVAGYDALNVDPASYWVSNPYSKGSGVAPTAPVAGFASIHAQYLAATKTLGLDYIPRFEYGGSYDLPVSAQAIGADGNLAKPNRFGPWSANLLDPATLTDLTAFLNAQFQPYVASNPQLKGALWRIREDRMQISYGPNDVAKFTADTGVTPPPGLTGAQLAAWASDYTTSVGPQYATWWHGKRRDFHQQVVNLLKSYRSDLTLYYYNWDWDKFSLKLPDISSAAFFTTMTSLGGPTAYANDTSARASYTASDYINVLTTGDFRSAGPASTRVDTLWADYALRPSLYSSVSGIQLFAPVPRLSYAKFPSYVNYFQTADGLAASNCVTYDEQPARILNPKFEGTMITPGGGAFSMAMELLDYFHGDARTLTYTAYTYGRGFADAHRRFAQAFLALPAVPGTLVSGTPTDVAARVYPTTNDGTYVGIAYKGYTAGAFTVSIPGTWTGNLVVTNLVTNAVTPASVVSGNLQITVSAAPMELDAYRVTTAPGATVTLTSVAADDGWVLGNSQGAGSSLSTTSIRAGDHSAGTQFKGFLSFDTSSIPATATVVSATLRLRRSGVIGTNPFASLGVCCVDIKGGAGFNGATTLQTADFQAAADGVHVGELSNAANNGDWSTASLDATGRGLVNKGGTTQLRVYFSTATNANGASDVMQWYAGDDSTAANRPVLEITYQ